MKAVRENMIAVLTALAEGYKLSLAEGYIIVENPKYAPDNGRDPYLVLPLDVAKRIINELP